MQSFALNSFERSSVLRNTYALLSMTLLWSAGAAAIGTQMHFSTMGFIALIILGFVSLFATMALRNSGWGIVMVFLFTGLEGLSIGPVLSHYLKMPYGSQIVGMSTFITGAVFLGLSAYVMTTRKNFNFLGGFLFMALLGMILVGLIGLFVNVPALHLALAFVGVLVFSGYILYDTSAIIHGGESNYIMATVALYLDILNLFLNVLRIVSFFTNSNDD